MAIGPTEHGYYCSRMDRERVWEWFHRNCFEMVEEAEDEVEEEVTEDDLEYEESEKN